LVTVVKTRLLDFIDLGLAQNPKPEARNSKWFDKLTTLSEVEGQIQISKFVLLKRFPKELSLDDKSSITYNIAIVPTDIS